MKCGIRTNGIVWPAKITSCSLSHPSTRCSRPAHVSPSLESSTRYCSLRLLTWSIRALWRPDLRASSPDREGIGASCRECPEWDSNPHLIDFESTLSASWSTRAGYSILGGSRRRVAALGPLPVLL